VVTTDGASWSHFTQSVPRGSVNPACNSDSVPGNAVWDLRGSLPATDSASGTTKKFVVQAGQHRMHACYAHYTSVWKAKPKEFKRAHALDIWLSTHVWWLAGVYDEGTYWM
jgi:hypothetical protein